MTRTRLRLSANQSRIAYDLMVTVLGAVLASLFTTFLLGLTWPWILVLAPPGAIAGNRLLGIYTGMRGADAPAKMLRLSASVFVTALLLSLLAPRSIAAVLLWAVLVWAPLGLPRWLLNLNRRADTFVADAVQGNGPVLVVGGAGYIGTHVVEQLLKADYRVRILDKLLYGPGPIQEFIDDRRVEIIEGDCTDIVKLVQAVDGAFAVVHLAGLVGDPACDVDDAFTRHANVIATRMVKDVAVSLGVHRFIFASSCSVYGAKDHEVSETSDLNPVSLYARTKIDSEQELLMVGGRGERFSPTILRFATVFGHSRRPRFDLVANLFTAQAMVDGKITLTGESQWRPFIHVRDLARAVVAVLKADTDLVRDQIFNVGDRRLNMTIGTVAREVQRIVSAERSVEILNQPDLNDHRNYLVNFDKLRKTLGFEASTLIQEGLQDVVNEFHKGTYGDYKDPSYSNLEMTKRALSIFQDPLQTARLYAPLSELQRPPTLAPPSRPLEPTESSLRQGDSPTGKTKASKQRSFWSVVGRMQVVWAFGLVGAGLLLGSGYRALDLRMSAVLDMQADKGTTVELFYNHLWTASRQLSLTPGRKTYIFEGLPRNLWDIRVDPTNVADAHVRVYGFQLRDGGRPAHKLDGQALGECQLINLTKARAPPGVAELLSTSGDPIIQCYQRYDFAEGSAFGRSISGWLTPSHLWIVFAAALVLASGWFGRYATGQIPAAIAAMIFLVGVMARHVGLKLGGPADVDWAIGPSNYNAYPKNAELNLFFLCVVCCVLASAALGLLAKRWAFRSPTKVEPVQSAWPPWARWIPVAIVMASVGADFPPLGRILESYKTAIHYPSYDWSNIFTWQYAAFRGWMPLRDFWYPYGGFYNYENIFPGGFREAVLHHLLLVSLLGYAAYRLERRSIGLAITVLLALMVGTWGGFFARPERALLSLDLVLLGLVVERERQLRWSLFFALCVAYAFVYEPNQLGYGAAALAGNLALQLLWPAPDISRQTLLRTVAKVGAISLAGLALTLLVFAWQHRLAGLWVLLRQMKPMAIYGSLTSAILEWFTFLPEAAHVLLLGALILVSFGVCLWLCARGDEERLAARVALATGVLAAVTVNKQIIRPGIANQMTVYVAVGAAMTLYLLRNSARLAQRRLMVLGMAFILAAWLEPVQVPVAFSAISARLGELPGDLRLLFRDSSEFQSVQADYFTSQQRFPTYLPLIRRLKELTGYRPGAGPKLKFYVFGDDAALYAAMQQKPPYYLTFYQESPVDAQMEVVRWLEWEDPTFIVWSPGFKEFDGVPNPVRVPIVFDSVIAKYEFLESVGEFDILRRRSSTSPFRLDYWRRKLGDFVDLRALPALSALRSSAPCKGVPRYCVEALRIHVTSPSPARTLAVPFRVGADRFEVKLSTFEGVNEYFINLQRLWFWGPLKRVGLTPELALAQRGPGMALLQLNSKLGLY